MTDENKTKENDDNVAKGDGDKNVDANTTEESETIPEEKTFTQSELDKIIADRLAREQKKRDEAVQNERDEAEKRKLEEQNKYKDLYEKAQQEIETAKADALSVKKDSLLVQAGYSQEQTEMARMLIGGETDEEIKTSIEQLKVAFPTQGDGVDPSPFNGRKDEVKPSDKEEIGVSAYERIKNKLF